MTNTLTELAISYRPKKNKGPKILSPYSAYLTFKEIYDPGTIQLREEFIVLYLDRANNVKGWHRISTGGIDSTIADLKLILGIALKSASSNIILSHNHPSGNLTPSQADIRLTEKIKNACNLIDITLFDHIIITSDGFMSFSEKGLL